MCKFFDFIRNLFHEKKNHKCPNPDCDGRLQEPDPYNEFDFRCPCCRKGFNYRDLPDYEVEDDSDSDDSGSDSDSKSTVISEPGLFIFAVLIPDDNLRNWRLEHESDSSFTEDTKDMLLNNNVWIGAASIDILDALIEDFRANEKDDGDVYMFIIEGYFDEYKCKIENSDFYRSDLSDLFDLFIQKNSCIQEFTAVDSTIDILSDNSPFDIPFIKP